MIDDIQVGDKVTFRFDGAQHTVKVTGFRTNTRHRRYGVVCNFQGWKKFVIRPEELISHTSGADPS